MSSSRSRPTPLNPSPLPSTYPSPSPHHKNPLIKKQLLQAIRTQNPSKLLSRSRTLHSASPTPNLSFSTSLLPFDSSQIHNNLTTKRRSYDDHKTKTTLKKKQIQELKREIAELTASQTTLKQRISYSKLTMEEANTFSSTRKLQNQTLFYQKQIYQHILQRTKTIHLHQKLHYNTLEQQIHHLNSKLSSTRITITQKTQLQKQCRKMLTSISRIVSTEKQERQTKLRSLHQRIIKRQEDIERRVSREKEITRLAEETANEKTAEEKEWGRLYGAHRLLHGVLKSKIERELGRNEKIEKSFQRVKVGTGVVQCDEFVGKYLGREERYGELLGKVSEKEPMLERLQRENERLGKELRELMEEESFELGRSTKETLINYNPEYERKSKHLQKLTEKMLVYQKQKESFYQWAIKFLKKYDAMTNEVQNNYNKLNYYQIYPRDQLDVLYKKIDWIVRGVMKDAERIGGVGDKLLENRGEQQMEEEVGRKNRRVRTEEDGGMDKIEVTAGEEMEIQREREREREKRKDKQAKQGGDYFNELEYVKEHRKNIIKQQRINKFRVKTKPN